MLELFVLSKPVFLLFRWQIALLEGRDFAFAETHVKDPVRQKISDPLFQLSA